MKIIAMILAWYGAVVGTIYWAENSESGKARRAAAAAEEQRERTPHVVREADGCKVYAFKAGDRYHYFTRCPASQVTTMSTWEECRGSIKQRTCETKSESIQ